jgi:ribonuclease HI
MAKYDGYVQIYADTFCAENKGVGGYGSILLFKSGSKWFSKELSASVRTQDPIVVSLNGIVAALEALKTPCSIVIFTTDSFLVNAVTGNYLTDWEARCVSAGIPGIDLWRKIDALCKVHKIEWQYLLQYRRDTYSHKAEELAHAATVELTKSMANTDLTTRQQIMKPVKELLANSSTITLQQIPSNASQ